MLWWQVVGVGRWRIGACCGLNLCNAKECQFSVCQARSRRSKNL